MLLLTLLHTLWLSVFSGIPDSTNKNVYIEKVSIEGNYRTRERIIRREMDLKVGDTLTTAKLDSLLEYDRRKILNTNLFVTVELKKIYVDSLSNPQKIALQVILKEQWYLLAFPVFELADRNFNEWWYERGRDLSRTIYGAYILQQNLTGNNDRLRLRAEFGFIPRLDIYYSIPYIDKRQKLGMTVGFVRITNRTLAYRTNLDKLIYYNTETRTRERITPYLTFTYRPRFYGFHTLSLQYSQTHISDSIAKVNSYYLLDSKNRQKYFQLSYSHVYDRRDRVQYPLHGYYYGIGLTKMGILPKDDINVWELVMTHGKFIPFSKKVYFSYTTKMKFSTPSLQPFLQFRGMGYENNFVRGYELYVIDGQHFGYLRTNLKYELIKRTFNIKKLIKMRQFNTFPLAIYPNIYVDGGYVSNKFTHLNNSLLANRWLVGGGIGIDFVTWYNFVARINYSVNHLGEARPYFSIGREF